MLDRPTALAHLRAIALAIVTAGVAGWFFKLVSRQTIRTFFDSSAYLETARQPWSFAQLYYPKPPVVPLVYRAIGTNLETIVRFQAAFAFLSWCALGAALLWAVRSVGARAAAVVVVAVFLVAQHRVGYTSVILSESINDSLMALVFAAVVMLIAATGRTRIAAIGALVVVATLWMFTRDTNAIVALVAIVICCAAWRGRLVRDRWALAAAACLAFVAVIAVRSGSVVPPPTGLSVQQGWAEDFTARTTLPMMDNLLDRVLLDDEARHFFVDHGMPQVIELLLLITGNDNRAAIYLDPAYAPARHWIAGQARSVWARWLLRHPITRVTELAQHGFTLLGIDREQSMYMPIGWFHQHSYLRAVTWERHILVALMLLAPIALWRARRHRAAFVAATMIVSGLVGSAIAFYGDTAEIGRHCFGSGQQVVFGLFLALIALTESFSKASVSRASEPR